MNGTGAIVEQGRAGEARYAKHHFHHRAGRYAAAVPVFLGSGRGVMHAVYASLLVRACTASRYRNDHRRRTSPRNILALGVARVVEDEHAVLVAPLRRWASTCRRHRRRSRPPRGRYSVSQLCQTTRAHVVGICPAAWSVWSGATSRCCWYHRRNARRTACLVRCGGAIAEEHLFRTALFEGEITRARCRRRMLRPPSRAGRTTRHMSPEFRVCSIQTCRHIS